MAIQIPNPGTGNGATGDNEFVLWSKVKDNFSNTTHAASKIVGTEAGNVMGVGAFGWGATGAQQIAYIRSTNRSTIPVEAVKLVSYNSDNRVGIGTGLSWGTRGTSVGSLVWGRTDGKLYWIYIPDPSVTLTDDNGNYAYGEVLLQGKNAFADGNGFWKTSSPVVKVYANEFDPNDDAKKQGVTYTRNGVGDYTLHNTLGLAQTGWQIELPQDNNRNPLVAIETEFTEDGDLIIRTYKRIFSMETFTFTCDYDNPLDIPDGRCVDVRLHEIPVEIEDDIQPEV